MLILNLLILASLAAQCGPSVAPSTTTAIIRTESGGNPYAIGDNTTRKSHFPKSRQDAIQLARSLLTQGHNLDLGLMQINSRHLKPRNLSLDEIFDPCRNINIGATILAEFYRANDNGEPRDVVLFKALSAYNTGSAWRGPGYVNRILKTAGAPYRVALTNPPPSGRTQQTFAKGSRNRSLFFPGTFTTGELNGLSMPFDNPKAR
jgi:type IV secretion system protein VirB1